MIKRGNKKAAEITTGTIIIIILALVVLVFLIVGFSMGWGNLWDSILNIGGGGKGNVQTIITACELACQTESQYAYCSQIRKVKFEDGTIPDEDLTCRQLEGKSVKLSCDKFPVDTSCPQ